MAQVGYAARLSEAWADARSPRRDGAPTVVSTFAGCGGSSLGYEMAGFRDLLAVEWDDNAVATLELNFPGLPIYHGDIARLSVDECCDLAGVEPGGLDVLDGSPPCQGFSTAGQRDLEDDRNYLFREYVRLLRGLRPRVLVMENVSGMVKGKMRLVFADVMRELGDAGYTVEARILNAAHYGVPQNRKRMIFVGVRADLGVAPSHPAATGPIVTLGQAVEGADTSPAPGQREFNDRYSRLWPHIRPGQNAYHVIGYGYNTMGKPNPMRPCPTLLKTTTGAGFATMVHWRERRALTVGEAARIGSFPDEFAFTGKFLERWARIGNSVPPLFMREIARHVECEILAEIKAGVAA